MKGLLMRIKCNKCNREMYGSELLPNVALYLGTLLSPILIPIITKALESYWNTPQPTPTKGFLDNSMAGIANISATNCPSCGKTECWDAYPEGTETIKEENKEATQVTQ